MVQFRVIRERWKRVCLNTAFAFAVRHSCKPLQFEAGSHQPLYLTTAFVSS